MPVCIYCPATRPSNWSHQAFASTQWPRPWLSLYSRAPSSESSWSRALQTFKPFHQLRRNGQPADVAWIIVFLVSNQPSGITGTVLTIDSGITERHEQGDGIIDGQCEAGKTETIRRYTRHTGCRDRLITLYSPAFKSSPTSAARHGNQPDP